MPPRVSLPVPDLSPCPPTATCTEGVRGGDLSRVDSHAWRGDPLCGLVQVKEGPPVRTRTGGGGWGVLCGLVQAEKEAPCVDPHRRRRGCPVWTRIDGGGGVLCGPA